MKSTENNFSKEKEKLDDWTTSPSLWSAARLRQFAKRQAYLASSTTDETYRLDAAAMLDGAEALENTAYRLGGWMVEWDDVEMTYLARKK